MMTTFFVGGIQRSRGIGVDERPRTVAVPDRRHVIIVDRITYRTRHATLFFSQVECVLSISDMCIIYRVVDVKVIGQTD
jgi:hypothetical protein